MTVLTAEEEKQWGKEYAKQEGEKKPSIAKDAIEEKFLLDVTMQHAASEEQSEQTTRDAPQIPGFAKLDRMSSGVMSAVGWALKNLGGKSDNFGEIKSLVTDTIQLAKGVETFAEIRKRLGAAPNRQENQNPLGIDTVAVSLLDELSRLTGKSNRESARQEANELGARIDLLRSDIYNANAIGLSCQSHWNLIRDDVMAKLTPGIPAYDVLRKYDERIVSFLVIPGFCDIGKFPDAESQLYFFRGFFVSFSQTMDNARTAGIVLTTDGFRVWDLAIEDCKTVVRMIDEILKKHAGVAPFLTERIETLNPLLGQFEPRAEFHQFDTVSHVANRALTTMNSVLNNPLLRSFRKSYLAKGHSSFPKLASEFGNKGQTERDVVDAASSQVKTMPIASAAPGVGDKIQADKSVESQPAGEYNKGPVGSLDDGNWSKYKQQLAQWESTNDYKKINTIGFVGKWQFGAEALIDLGYVKPGTSTRSLEAPSVWTGKDGISKRQDFLDNKDNVQDKCLFIYTKNNYKRLISNGTLSTGDSPSECGGYLAAAHLKGPGGARKLKNGQDNSDAYGTKASKYYNGMKGVISGSVPMNEASSAVKSSGGNDRAQTAAFVDSTTLSDAPRAFFPSSDTSSVKYPYNKVKTTEAGHFKEYDSTPGNERIQERHRTGTGYEIDSSGALKTLITKDNYTAVLGSNWIMVQGACHITALGDVTVRSGGKTIIEACSGMDMNIGGDFNLNVSGNMRRFVGGTDLTTVTSDSAEVVGGYKKIGVSGDTQYEAASVNIIARDSQVNLSAKKDVQIAAIGKFHAAGKAKAMLTSGGSIVVAAGGDVSTSGTQIENMAQEFSVNSVQTKIRGSQIHLKSDATIQVEPKVSHARHTEEADKAMIMAVVVKPPLAAASPVFDAANEVNERMTGIKSDKFDKVIKEFNPVDGKSQAFGSGEPAGKWDGKGFSKGVSDDQKIDV